MDTGCLSEAGLTGSHADCGIRSGEATHRPVAHGIDVCAPSGRLLDSTRLRRVLGSEGQAGRVTLLQLCTG